MESKLEFLDFVWIMIGDFKYLLYFLDKIGGRNLFYSFFIRLKIILI